MRSRPCGCFGAEIQIGAERSPESCEALWRRDDPLFGLSRDNKQGPSQWVTLEFPQRICVSQLQIQFQGGFSCHQGRLEGSQGSEAFGKIVDFYPEDNNSLQTFPVPAAEVDRLKVTFENTTDFFGRVVIYHLRVLGEKKV
ncbi:nuclear receptor 2C2-associated protein isoform X2 [Vicugna pacos]|uniref:Nuclear receptor 2C2-associated protein isoform X2 n=1 Tax=Vicugna pacos TaxID=30538 RepID=A0ABM5C438_VICPA